MATNFADPRWMTYKQAQTQGWQARGGERATQIQHWIWEVFNAEQIDGIPALE
jgi:antirestriction protein ArdC